MQNQLEIGERLYNRFEWKRPQAPIQLDIQPAKRHEMVIAANILRSSAEWYRPFLHEKDMAQHTVDNTWGEMEFDRRRFFIGRNQDVPVGVISTQSVQDMFYIGYIYVYAHQVGKGFGPQLLSHVRDLAWEEGKRGMVLIAHPKAIWATRAYTRFGFECIATTREQVLEWQQGWLKPYYEEGFQLYQFLF
ncbi:GNAT family N-acetyltransferase [Candidatus Nitronereus thalassa]|uniref:GNAT family N-acetyltransferase n=1 Tax=Candidatus Nitronereus thalassa TaxID=3020898 RepID=A0ABU3KBR4_9BACT|nr:GNAT family N-acetyltransferase [Candidatus Nitronereus thalassa]MDT7043879.1 GNAT family N-acetyltransferase [Candidatus Nitronereus thalassa]